jgi:peptide-methionine (S)-S-oxide reductase
VAKEQATLAGGCFWCLEAVYEQLKGVEKVVSGYAGGAKDDPSYEEVCGGDTGHAEVVQVTYDPKLVSFKEILDVFFSIHDPTTLNRQGNDVGTQYRSAVFYHDAQQKRAAEAAIADITKKGVWDDPIVTSLESLTKFFPAEEYHQHYYARNPTQGYCRVVIAPKVAKFRKTWESRLRANA